MKTAKTAGRRSAVRRDATSADVSDDRRAGQGAAEADRGDRRQRRPGRLATAPTVLKITGTTVAMPAPTRLHPRSRTRRRPSRPGGGRGGGQDEGVSDEASGPGEPHGRAGPAWRAADRRGNGSRVIAAAKEV